MKAAALQAGSQLATILVVDDDRLNRVALAELLQPDFRVLMARDGPSGLEILTREAVSLVLLDVSMPGMDGYAVLRAIRAAEHTSNLPVIFITGMSDAADEERGLLLGAADFVHKPIRPAIVRARVMTHLRLARQRNEMEALASLDGLTGIANRRCFDATMDRVARQTTRSNDVMGIALFDVDHFKQYNDHYGHGAGDQALRTVAVTLTRFARRAGELAARYGGEEFVLLLPGCSELEEVMNSFRQSVEDARIPHERSATSDWLTVSGGGVVVPATALAQSGDALALADQLLYRAKAGGRNRVLVVRA
ncbi:diguanylate cyclase domain-containing protein [Rhodobacter sp. 24-YEA-8]|uniref:GGDEF domain-containing response regulator n=1 Tax=Rhodobacter sp. 24-YEA-8 TaxID=1884310 RepID=UPI000897383F|nr:diguanylate cyclase [Rhodobacter sp. 24-YEA-8]SEC77082.1 response regulator receiver modulated diguanylate cyclase [Rhodobacter sp. 24-YEA-8]